MFRLITILPVCLALGVATSAVADPEALPGTPVAVPQRTTSIVVYGNDPCPKGQGDEIVVCARRPESERYRIPPSLRHKKPIPAEGSWTNNASMLDQISRQQMTPDSCSPNGSNGQTGCTMQMLHQWYQERKQQKADDDAIP